MANFLSKAAQNGIRRFSTQSAKDSMTIGQASLIVGGAGVLTAGLVINSVINGKTSEENRSFAEKITTEHHKGVRTFD